MAQEKVLGAKPKEIKKVVWNLDKKNSEYSEHLNTVNQKIFCGQPLFGM